MHGAFIVAVVFSSILTILSPILDQQSGNRLSLTTDGYGRWSRVPRFVRGPRLLWILSAKPSKLPFDKAWDRLTPSLDEKNSQANIHESSSLVPNRLPKLIHFVRGEASPAQKVNSSLISLLISYAQQWGRFSNWPPNGSDQNF